MGVYRRAYSKNGIKRISRYWYCRDPFTGLEKSLHVTDRAVAQIIYGDMVKAAEMKRAGYDTHYQTRTEKPLALLERYLADVERQRRSAHHLRVLRTRLTYFLQNLSSLSQLTTEQIRVLIRMKVEKDRLSAKTQNEYLAQLGGFFSWLIGAQLWTGNPVDAVGRATVVGKTFERFALELEELERLIDTAPIWRAAVYVLAANTGLRRGELAQLREVDVDLDSGSLRVRAQTAKNKLEDVLPLNPWTVDVLRRYLAAVPPDQKVDRNRFARPRGELLFPAIPRPITLKRDLKKIGVAATNAQGEIFDFHALRTTFATLLAREEVSLQQAQRLLRHSDPRLTANVYTKLQLHDGRAAVGRIRPRGAGKGAGEPVDNSRNGVEGADSVEGPGRASG